MAKHYHPFRVTTSLILVGVFLSGCSNAKEGALSGAGIGALSGLAIGSISGNAGEGAAIGAIAGAVGGAVIGDQNRRRDEAAAAAAKAPTQTTVVYAASPPQAYATGRPLGQLVGSWRIKGSVDDGRGTTLPIGGTATGEVDKTYFVRLDLRLTDPRDGRPVTGTSMISQTGGRGIEMSNSFSTSPDVVRFRGEMDASGSFFTLSEVSPSPGARRVILRISPGREWTADMWRGDTRSESFTFIPL